ncbi:MAG: response regulator [Oscillochloris sp.]|nr:response regulator [Oscillochloris sp.]
MHILIVDDEPDLCWALERMLRTSGVTISAVGCAAAALDLVRQHSYAVAFVDAILPDANGIQLAEQIHALSPHTRLVVMSGYYYQEDQSLTQAPLAGFLSKPFLRADVRTILQQALSADICQREECACHTSC